MKDAHTDTGYGEDVETALLDVELFLKYRSHTRAIARLQEAIKNNPHAIKLREKLREVALANGQPEEAARQCSRTRWSPSGETASCAQHAMQS